MKYKSFPEKFWNLFEVALDQEMKTNSRPVAVFDADGTLWDTDLGEAFFKWQIKNSGLSLPKNPWEHYRKWKESGDPRPAYLWLAQINQGQPLEQVQKWADQALKEAEPVPIFSEQEKLIRWLVSKKVEVYIVTASVKWAVEPGARKLGLSNDHVIGVSTLVKNGIVTDQQSGTITYREGKIQALVEKTQGRKPFLSCGNTMGDIALLQNSTQLSLAVGAAPESHELFKTEEALRTEATQNSWLIHRF